MNKYLYNSVPYFRHYYHKNILRQRYLCQVQPQSLASSPCLQKFCTEFVAMLITHRRTKPRMPAYKHYFYSYSFFTANC
jgi:hypothetical protein